MLSIWFKPLLWLMLFGMVGTGFGLLLSWKVALLWLIGALLFMHYRHIQHLSALNQWLADGGESSLPDANGVWDEVFYGLDRMVRRNKRSAARLVAALDRFEHAAQAIPDGVVMLNEQGQIDWINAIASQHYGLNERTDCGQFITYLIRQSAFINYLSEKNFQEALVMKSPAMRDTTLSIQMITFGERQQMLISRDITQLEKVDAMRRDFVANVSHELRTPLTVVGGFLENFIDMPHIPREDFLRYCTLMAHQTERMRRLVEDLLILSRLESGQDRLLEQRVNMRELTEALYQEALSLSAGRHVISLQHDSEDDLIGNLDELTSALGNLVSNAIRYTPTGKAIHLRWGWRNDVVCFTVQDEGEGIEAQHIPRLTERFYRVDRGRSRETGGTGLGLAIVKHVLTRHHAYLLVTSEIGQGSCFSACFPLSQVFNPNTVSSHTQ